MEVITKMAEEKFTLKVKCSAEIEHIISFYSSVSYRPHIFFKILPFNAESILIGGPRMSLDFSTKLDIIYLIITPDRREDLDLHAQ